MLAGRLFGLPPFDERIVRRTEMELALAVEAELCLRGHEPVQCPRCDGWTYDKVCPCSPTQYVDPIEQLAAAGEDIDQAKFDELWNAKG